MNVSENITKLLGIRFSCSSFPLCQTYVTFAVTPVKRGKWYLFFPWNKRFEIVFCSHRVVSFFVVVVVDEDHNSDGEGYIDDNRRTTCDEMQCNRKKKKLVTTARLTYELLSNI